MINRKNKLIIASIAAVVAQLVVPTFIEVAHAAPPQFKNMFVRVTTHKELTPTSLTVCAHTSAAATAGTETQVKISLPMLADTTGLTNFVYDTTATDWETDTSNLPKDPVGGGAATAWPSIGAAASNYAVATSTNGPTLTFASGNLAADTFYCFNILSKASTPVPLLTLSTHTSASNIIGATVYTQNSSNVTIEQTNWSTAIITDDTISISAVVPPAFSLALSANTDAFQVNLDPNRVISTAGVNVTITTNAVGGWIVWTKDAGNGTIAGLKSVLAAHTIPSGTVNGAPDALNKGGASELYGMDVDVATAAGIALPSASANGCLITLDPEYNGTYVDANTNATAGALSLNFQPIAKCNRQDPTVPGTSDGDILTLTERAVIRGGTPAGSDYADIISVVGAGNF